MRRAVLLLLLASAPAHAETPAPAAKGIDCYCTDRQHNRVELGEIICMQVDGRMFTARCEMSLNNPMWREIGEGCATSRLQGVEPPLDPRLVDPEV